MDEEALTKMMGKYEIDEVFHSSKIMLFDTAKYFCCDSLVLYMSICFLVIVVVVVVIVVIEFILSK